ncbi:MAG: hypothetical protein UZ22_OP11002000322 [Microgenomates bacterium OLB23]|nr:MAG: hypothetical protein UZ22_OP11002000322 [Microgenomates bacterium OLB23]
MSDKAKAVGDANLAQLNGTKIDLKDEQGQLFNGLVTHIQLLSKEDANPVYYQTRAIRDLNGYHILTCHRQDLHGDTNQWLWITVEKLPDHLEVLTGYGLDIVAPKGTFSPLPR